MLGRAVAAYLALAWLPALPCAAASAGGGPGWSAQALPVAPSAITVPLSCSSSTACTTVATDYPFPSSNRDVLLALRWNGRGWARELMPEPTGISTFLISGISCPSATSCVAVGGSAAGDPPGPYAPLVERWNGTAWAIEPVPAPLHGLSSRLSSVSCTSPSACIAVGQSALRDPRRPSRALVERFNGTAWSIERAPARPLIDVSCSSPVACTALANTARQTLAERWDGVSWSIEPTPHPRPLVGPEGDNELASVSCTSRDACTAVGDSTAGSGFNSARSTLAERWNGSRWAVQATPDPIRLDALNSVSCSTGSSCVAVGEYSDRAGTATLPLIERWRHDRWSALRAPRRLSTGEFADSTLLTVDCFTNGNCLALGDAQGGPFAAQFASTAG
jgi:hypothetical protein